MSQELLAVLSNPKRRRRRKGAHRKAASRRRRRARRSDGRFVASTHTTTVSRRRGYHINPRRRRRYHQNPRRRYYRNPRGISIRGLGADLVCAAAGAVGGIGLDLLMRPMPLEWKAGPLNHLVRGAASIGLGIVGQLVNFPYAGDVAKGAMTVTLYNAARQYVLLPRGLGELTDEDVAALSGVAGVGEVIDVPAISNQVGELVSMDGLGQSDDELLMYGTE